MHYKQFNRRTLLVTALIAGIAVVSHSQISLADSPNTKTFTFIQLCDTQLGFGGYEHDINTFKQAVKQINAIKPDFVVICGDLVNKFDDKSVADFNKIKDEFTVPCYCAAGNHDVGNPTPASLKKYRETIGLTFRMLRPGISDFAIADRVGASFSFCASSCLVLASCV